MGSCVGWIPGFLDFRPQWMKLVIRIIWIAQIIEHLKSLKLNGKSVPYINFAIWIIWKMKHLRIRTRPTQNLSENFKINFSRSWKTNFIPPDWSWITTRDPLNHFPGTNRSKCVRDFQNFVGPGPSLSGISQNDWSCTESLCPGSISFGLWIPDSEI